MERGGSLQRQLRERNGVSVQRDWCEACVQWLLEEEVSFPNSGHLVVRTLRGVSAIERMYYYYKMCYY